MAGRIAGSPMWVRPAVSRPQAAREEHEQRHRKQHGEDEQRRLGLSEVEIVPAEAKPFGQRATDADDDISQRDHTAAPRLPTDLTNASAVRTGHRVEKRMRRSAVSP